MAWATDRVKSLNTTVALPVHGEYWEIRPNSDIGRAHSIKAIKGSYVNQAGGALATSFAQTTLTFSVENNTVGHSTITDFAAAAQNNVQPDIAIYNGETWYFVKTIDDGSLSSGFATVIINNKPTV